MLRLKKYFKPFISVIVLCVCLLFVQAMCDLKLPDYMSDIVNTGIQSNGIAEEAPNAISENGIKLMIKFMNGEEKKLVTESYTKVLKGDKEYAEEYPLLEKEDIYVLKDVEDSVKEKLNEAFSTSAKIMTNVMTTMSQNGNLENSASGTKMDESKKSVEIDMKEVYKMLPMLEMLPQDVIDEARATAKTSDDLISTQIAKVFTKGFYTELGVNTQDYQRAYIIQIGIKMLGISLLGSVAAMFVGLIAARTSAGISKNIRRDVFEKVESFASKEFNKFSASSLITRTTNDVVQVQNMIAMALRILAFAPIMGIGSLIMMIDKTTRMTWTIGVGIICVLILIITIFRLVMPKIKIMQKLTDRLNLVSKENLSGIMVIRAFGTQKHEGERFAEVNTDVTKTNRFVNRTIGFMMPCMSLIMNLLVLLIVWVGAKQIAASTMQIGDVMAVIQYAMHVVMSFLMLSMIFIIFPRASVSAGRIADVLETENTILDPENSKEFDNNRLGYVEFKNVDFSYENADEKVLENISFVAKPGQTTAIIGSTGSGKSTLINLIPRLFDATKGEVLVNGLNVKDIKQEVLHDQIGYIPQKGNLLSGTIESNLKYGAPEASDEFMKKCSEVAQVNEFIEKKEEGYGGAISQGAKNVSGGQKQRLSIARALVKKARIYIFDDSFSALDYKTDVKLRSALKEHTGDSTLIIVAQRISTIMNADQILVLDEGKLVGKGTHKELLENCPTYYEIALSQLSKEELGNAE